MKQLRSIWSFTIVLAIAMLFTYCSGGGEAEKNNTSKNEAKGDTTKATEKTEKNKQPLQTDRKFNDIARFIAGLPTEEGSELVKLGETPAWKQYAQSVDAQWKNINDRKLPKMLTWAKEELKAVNDQKGTLFYPFSGADFQHAAIFFPEAEETVMIGLEPIGKMPEFEKINQKGSLGAYFNGIRRSLVTIMEYSFFKTNDMAVDFTGRVTYDIDGTLPVILLFMARSNHRILFYERVAINQEGKIVKPEDIVLPKGEKNYTYYGTKITYRREDKPDEVKNLYYFGVNLSNDAYMGQGGLNQRKDLMKYLESLPIHATYLKSASYLMYKDFFSKIREVILNKSKYVLQDDSGMALKNFLNDKWGLTFYGRYAGPISLFANYWQNDMKKAFEKKEQVRPLPFGIGYQFREGSSNLMLAKKK
jgi:hypothetical protein